MAKRKRTSPKHLTSEDPKEIRQRNRKHCRVSHHIEGGSKSQLSNNGRAPAIDERKNGRLSDDSAHNGPSTKSKQEDSYKNALRPNNPGIGRRSQNGVQNGRLYNRHHQVETSRPYQSEHLRFPFLDDSHEPAVQERSDLVDSGSSKPPVPIAIPTNPKYSHDRLHQQRETLNHSEKSGLSSGSWFSSKSNCLLDTSPSKNSNGLITSKNISSHHADAEDTDSSESTSSSSSSDSESEEDDQNTAHPVPGAVTDPASRSKSDSAAKDEANRQICREPALSRASRDDLQFEAEKTIAVVGKRINKKNAKTANRPTTAPEPRLFSKLRSVIPEHIFESTRARLQSAHSQTKSKSERTRQNNLSIHKGKPTNEAVVLEAAREVILRLSAQKMANGFMSSSNVRSERKTSSHRNDQTSILAGPPSTAMQNELTRIVHDKDDKIRLLELELRNHRQKLG